MRQGISLLTFMVIASIFIPILAQAGPIADLYELEGLFLEEAFWKQELHTRWDLFLAEATLKSLFEEYSKYIKLAEGIYGIYNNLLKGNEIIPEDFITAVFMHCIFDLVKYTLKWCYHSGSCNHRCESSPPSPEWPFYVDCCCNPFSEEYFNNENSTPFRDRFKELGYMIETKQYDQAFSILSKLKPGVIWVKKCIENNIKKRRLCLDLIPTEVGQKTYNQVIDFTVKVLQNIEKSLDAAEQIIRKEEKLVNASDLCRKLQRLLWNFWDTDRQLFNNYAKGADEVKKGNYEEAIQAYYSVISGNKSLLQIANNIKSTLKQMFVNSLYTKLDRAIVIFEKSPYTEHAEKWIIGLQFYLQNNYAAGNAYIKRGNELFDQRNKALGTLFDAICHLEDYLEQHCSTFKRHPWSHRR